MLFMVGKNMPLVGSQKGILFWVPSGFHGFLHVPPFAKRARNLNGGFVESFAFGGEFPTEALGTEGVSEKKVGEPKNAWALPYCVGMSHLAWSCL